MFKTRVTELLGIKHPIIQGAMLWLGRAELAAAVSNAGGLGIITSGIFETAEEVRQEIKKAKSLTDKPFAVNISLLPTRRSINWEEYIYVALDEGVNIIETSGRSPEPYVEWIKQAKVTHMHKVARLRDAKTAERLGAHMVTIVGFEGGGHPGMEDVTSLIRVPRTVDSLKIPVIAAGGFGDGRGLVAALALGAEAITMGTRFMLCKECPMHPKIKEMLLNTKETDTMLIQRSINNASRVVRNDFAQKVLAMEEKGATIDELYPLLRGTRTRETFISGDITDSVFWCGQVVGLANEILSAKEIIDRTISEAELVMQRLNRMGTSK